MHLKTHNILLQKDPVVFHDLAQYIAVNIAWWCRAP
ncbi:hypothetical protein NC653_016525 [Populus alba x Populus x berolinensis]|uniref:Uncharacterized protein n=1 Tax=Populus alba x Populus x berolinensis TaxID=444605 RepID=A0AAD6QNB3_9ROSI|nr:hypothetical protein NC653_016525 [Populus alba x Populus x berolinensis]